MRKCLTSLILVGSGLSSTSVAPAGLFNPAESVDFEIEDGSAKPLPFEAFRSRLLDVLDVPLPDKEAHKRAEQRCAQLAGKPVRDLSPTELAGLSADLIRLRRFSEARKILQPATRSGEADSVAFAHLSRFYQEEGNAETAARTFEESLRTTRYPTEWPNVTKAQWRWLARIERDSSRLWILHRAAESEGRLAGPPGLDPVFGVSFVGESGRFEPGTLAKAEAAKLPKDALAVVQQMVLWYPDDARLYWLLGELYNARGDILAAELILNQCVDTRRYTHPMLMEHRHLVAEAAKAERAKAPPAEPAAPPAEDSDRSDRYWLAGGIAAAVFVLFFGLQIRDVVKRRGGRPGCNSC